MFWLSLLIALWGAPACGSRPECFYRAEVEHVHDGDTVRASLHIKVIGVRTEATMIRSDFDCWEISRARRSEPFKSFTDAEWKAEIAKGKAARAALLKLLETHELYVSPTDQKSSYGRSIMRWVAYDPKTDTRVEVAKWLQERGHLRADIK